MDKDYRGIGFWGALQLALIILKLCHIITWSWIVVFTPVLISLVILIVFLIVIWRVK